MEAIEVVRELSKIQAEELGCDQAATSMDCAYGNSSLVERGKGACSGRMHAIRELIFLRKMMHPLRMLTTPEKAIEFFKKINS